MQSAAQMEINGSKSKEELWNHLLPQIKVQRKTKLKRLLTIIPKLAAAAIVVIGIIIISALSHNKITVMAKNGEHLEHFLPDGSYVFIQPDSKLSYNKKAWEKKREINLTGEAFFSVKNGSRFTVISPKGEVAVKGTKFNVVDRKKLFKVECVEGKVQVALNNKQHPRFLLAGNYTKLSENGKLIVPKRISTDKVTGRLNGTFFFEKEKLENVIEELERQLGIKIQLEANKTGLFTGHFYTNTIDEALKMVCLPMGLVYTVNGNNVAITN